MPAMIQAMEMTVPYRADWIAVGTEGYTEMDVSSTGWTILSRPDFY